jgi:hypothetical protein
MSDVNWNQLLNKIENLMTLADRTESLGEAQAAAAGLTRLLTRHSLTMDEVTQRLHGQQRKSDYDSHEVTTDAKSTWQQALIGQIAKFNFGRAITMGNGVVRVVAEPHSFIVIKHLYLYLDEAFTRLANDSLADKPPQVHTKTWKNNFFLGAVEGVIDAMKDAQKAEAENVEHGSALVVVKDNEVAMAFKQLYPRTRKATRAYSHNQQAFGRGYEAGRNVNLSPQIGD